MIKRTKATGNPSGSLQQTEENLPSNSGQLQFIADHAPVMIAQVDSELRYIFVNQQFAAMFKKRRDEIIGLHVYELLDAETFAVAGVYMRETLAGKTVEYDIELKFVPNGPVFVHAKYSPQIDKAGKIVGFVAAISDITVQKTLEKKLERERSDYNKLVDAAPVMVVYKSIDDHLVKVNKAFADFLGKTKEEILGKTTFDVMAYSETAQSVRNHDLEVINTGNPVMNHTIKWSGFHGEKEIWVVYSKMPFYDSDGNISGTVTYATDISTIVKSEQALRESEERFRNMFENSSVGKSMTMVDGQINVNKAFCRMLGYSSEELSKMNWKDLTHKDDIARDQMIIDTILSGEKSSARWEKRYINHDGNIVWTDIHTTLQRDHEGKPVFFITTIVDITEKKRTEELLLKSEKKFSMAFMTSPYAITITRAKDGKFTEVNEAFSTITGYTRSETLADSSIGLALWDDMEDRKKVVLDLIKGVPVQGREFRFRRKNGEIMFGFFSAQYVSIGDEKHILSSINDITDRKLAEQKIREKDIEFRKLSANVPDLIFQFTRRPDGSYCVPIASAGIKNIFGCTPEDVADDFTAIASVIYPEDSERVIADIEYSAKHLTYFTCEFRVQIPGRDIQWIYSRSTPERLPDGSVTWYGFNVDITRMKLAEEALKAAKEKAEESEFRLKLAQQVSKAGSWDWDIKNNTFYWSDEFLQVFGLPKDTIAGFEAWTKVLHPDDIEPASARIMKAIEDHTELLNDYRIILPDKNIRWIRSSGHTNYESGIPVRMLGLCWDITDQKMAELELQTAMLKSEESESNLLLKNEEYEVINEELTQTNEELQVALQKAEESERLKTAFLANMSHEIRTPMNGILGFAELLKEPDLTGEQQQHYLAIIEKSGQRMLNTINELIEISKIDARQVKLEYADTDINEMTDFLYNFFEPEMEKKHLEFILHSTQAPGALLIKTDKEKLYAILINLLKNAVKYTPEGKVEFGYSLENESVKFFVKDTGIGIPKDRQQAIFERFVQADIEDKNAMEGSGLGLAISKAYCEMLGGQLVVDSSPGRGSAFWLTIPAIQTIPAAGTVFSENETKKVEQALKNLSVLIAEDEEISDLFLSEMLGQYCGEIFHAADGREAVELLKNNPQIRLVLMDIKMPVINGYEATREIRKFNPDVVIIAQTAYALSGDREKALEAGCNDYLTKPIKKNILFEKIKKIGLR